KGAEEGLQKSREVTQTRHDFYNNILARIDEEENQLNELATSESIQTYGQLEEILAEGLISAAPDVSLGFSAGGAVPAPFPTISMSLGRGNLIAGLQAVGRARGFLASVHTYKSN